MALVGSNSGVRDLDPEGTFAEVDKVIRGGEGGFYIQNLSDGRSIAATYRPMPDGGLLVTFEDITQRKQAEQALTASEARLKAALSNMTQGLVMHDAKGKMTLFNRRFAEIFGLPPDENLQSMTIPELLALAASRSGVHLVDPEGGRDRIEKSARGAGEKNYIHHLSDGRSIATTVGSMPDGGNVVTFEDITQRTEAEEAVAASEAKLQTALSNMSQGLVMLDAEGRLRLFNPRYAEIFGMPPDQILPGMTVPQLMALAVSTSGIRDVDPEGTLVRTENVLRGGEGGSFTQNLNDGRSITDLPSADVGRRGRRDVRGHHPAKGGGTGAGRLRVETSIRADEHVAGSFDA